MVFKIFFQSIRKLLSQWKLWLAVYLFISVLALLAAVPVSKAFANFAGTSDLAASITSGNLTETPLFEFSVFHRDCISQLFTILPILIGLTILFYLFFKGGFIAACLKKDCTLPAPEFLRISAVKFPGLFLIAASSLVFVIPVLLLNLPLSALCRWISGDSEPLFALMFILRAVLLLFIFITIKAAFDFAQISSVYKKGIKTFSAVKNGWIIFFRYPFKIFGLIFIALAAGIAVTLIYSSISRVLNMETAIGTVAHILLLQAVLFIRTGIILAFTCSEAGLFSEYEVPLLKWWYDGRSQQGISE